MKKALFKFVTIPADKDRKSGTLELSVPVSPSTEVEPDIVVANLSQFQIVNEEKQLFKLATVMIFSIPIYSDYQILNKDEYKEFFKVEMNKDFPSRLLVSTVCSTDAVCVKPVKLVEYYN